MTVILSDQWNQQKRDIKDVIYSQQHYDDIDNQIDVDQTVDKIIEKVRELVK